MPHQILKSNLPTEEAVNSFQRLANEFIQELEKHDAHMKNVARNPAKYQPYPAPTAHPDIAASIIREDDEYNISFEIIDDLAPPPPTFEQKKSQLLFDLRSAFNEFAAPFRPSPLKQGIYQIEMMKLMSVQEEDRTEEQDKKIAEHERKQKILSRNAEKLAYAEGDIDDLTEETIDAYQIPKFSEEVK